MIDMKDMLAKIQYSQEAEKKGIITSQEGILLRNLYAEQVLIQPLIQRYVTNQLIKGTNNGQRQTG